MRQKSFLYETVSRQLREQIFRGSYIPGEKLPSVRQLSRIFNVSINTILQCFRQLEADGLIKTYARSGVFVVRPKTSAPRGTVTPLFPMLPVEVSLSERILNFMEPHIDQSIVPLGIALPAQELMPVNQVLQTYRDVTRAAPHEAWGYTHPHGYDRLTHQLARRSLNYPVPIAEQDIVVTNGCMEAMELALRAVTRPGNTVAIESPTYYGALLALEIMGRKALQISTTPGEGVSLSALDQALRLGQVDACLFSTNAQNPLGFTMGNSRKQELVQLLARHQVPMIENDIWGDTVFQGPALPAKAFDEEGLVIYCNSFSKSLMPGMRLGWTAPGRFHRRILELKQVSSITTATPPQMLMSRLLESGFYQRHLQKLRCSLQSQTTRMVELIRAHFPAGTQVAEPTGGCVLWITLPGHIDAEILFHQALKQQIHVFPGAVFSPGRNHYNCLRINAGGPVTQKLEEIVAQLGELTRRL
jgi:DNA-binding transcriptional MocR family regulator